MGRGGSRGRRKRRTDGLCGCIQELRIYFYSLRGKNETRGWRDGSVGKKLKIEIPSPALTLKTRTNNENDTMLIIPPLGRQSQETS